MANKEVAKTNETKITKEDVTVYVIPQIAKKYLPAISKVLKEGTTYEVIFTEGYTMVGQKSRKCKDVPGIKWLSKMATIEKANGFDKEYWLKWLKDNKIVFDGTNIPEYFWTKEQYEKYKVEVTTTKKNTK